MWRNRFDNIVIVRIANIIVADWLLFEINGIYCDNVTWLIDNNESIEEEFEQTQIRLFSFNQQLITPIKVRFYVDKSRHKKCIRSRYA